ncbi:MAG TPA: hypothetical protein VL328_12580 [Gemmatimonadaceae bacterium]|jgi:hypothetical protein|nr:hypothetical protein [Gemmatimonadaceae bacterium]
MKAATANRYTTALVALLASLASVQAQPSSGRVNERTFLEGECQSAGGAWKSELAATPGLDMAHLTILVFLGAAEGRSGICYYNREYGVVGDPIFVAVFTDDADTWAGVEFEPCALQSAAPSVLESTYKYPLSAPNTVQRAEATWRLQTYLPRTCFNTAVEVTLTGDRPQKYPLRQYERYRATLNGGTLFTTLHSAEFALRPAQDDPSRKFIYDKAPAEKGPEYIATLQLYGIGHYLPSLIGRRNYRGRDPVNDQSLVDRIGGIVGVGITNPKERFALGLSLEVIYGVSVIWVDDFARINRLLPETSITEPFAGAEAEIPARESWQSHGSLGLALDLRYLALLFTGNRQ